MCVRARQLAAEFLNPVSINRKKGPQTPASGFLKHTVDDTPFIVLTETRFSFRCIPVWDRYSPYRTRV